MRVCADFITSFSILLNESCSLVLFNDFCSSLYGESLVSLLRDTEVAFGVVGVAACDTDVALDDNGVVQTSGVSPIRITSSSFISSKRGMVGELFALGGTGMTT
jgi:hypothetical protein